MLDRQALIMQMAKVIVGESVMDPVLPNEDARRCADEVLSRVELFLGVDVEQAKEIVTKVLEEVS